MDTLTFNTPILFRHLTFSEAKKQPILEVDLKKPPDGFDTATPQVEPMSLTMAFSDNFFLQSIESCLLLRCDHLKPMDSLGPKLCYNQPKSMAARAMSSSTSGPSASFLSNHSTQWNLKRRRGTTAKRDDEAGAGKKKQGGIQIPGERPCEGAEKRERCYFRRRN